VQEIRRLRELAATLLDRASETSDFGEQARLMNEAVRHSVRADAIERERRSFTDEAKA
jgi:hypothetical protein